MDERLRKYEELEVKVLQRLRHINSKGGKGVLRPARYSQNRL